MPTPLQPDEAARLAEEERLYLERRRQELIEHQIEEEMVESILQEEKAGQIHS